MILGTDNNDDKVIFLVDVFFHEVNSANTDELLLKYIHTSVKAVVSQQGNKVHGLFKMVVAVSLIGDKDLSLLQ